MIGLYLNKDVMGEEVFYTACILLYYAISVMPFYRHGDEGEWFPIFQTLLFAPVCTQGSTTFPWAWKSDQHIGNGTTLCDTERGEGEKEKGGRGEVTILMSDDIILTSSLSHPIISPKETC